VKYIEKRIHARRVTPLSRGQCKPVTHATIVMVRALHIDHELIKASRIPQKCIVVNINDPIVHIKVFAENPVHVLVGPWIFDNNARKWDVSQKCNTFAIEGYIIVACYDDSIKACPVRHRHFTSYSKA